MSKKKQNYMPAQTAGLTRFKEEGNEIIKFKPEHAIALTVGVIVIEILLWTFGKGFL